MKIAQEKLKICHICTKYPPAVSGIAKHVYDLSRLQAENGHAVTIYCPDDIGDISSVDIPNNVNVIQLKSLGRPLNNPITPSIVIQLLKNDFDIVHAHDFFLFGTMVAGFIKKIKKYPFIVTHHTNKLQYDTKMKNLFQDLYIRIIAKKILKTADRVIVHNKENKKILSELGISNIEIIPNGVNSQDYLTRKDDLKNFKRDLNIKENEKIILFVGRLTYRKGVLDLIRAFSIIVKNCPKTKLVIVGNGPLMDDARKLTEDLQVGEKVKFLGFISSRELIQCYHLADITAMPSIFGEAHPIVTLESLICGTPLVASDLPCFREMVPEENICLVPPGDFMKLAETITKLFRHDEILTDMKRNCREFVLENYDWKDIHQKMEKLYGNMSLSQ